MRYFTIGLALFAFYLWGEQRILRSSLANYVELVHLQQAKEACTKEFIKEYEGEVDPKKFPWATVMTDIGRFPDSIFFRYFRIGQLWDYRNASLTMHLTSAPDKYRCVFHPPDSAAVDLNLLPPPSTY